MKYFAFSDAHGDYLALVAAVKKYGYDPKNKEHRLISCGDNFGRSETGAGSKGIYDYLRSPEHVNPPICLKGNHELILKDILIRRDISFVDKLNGEDKTVYSLLGKDIEKEDVTPEDIKALYWSDLFDWLQGLPYYFETKNCLFVHGFLPFDRDTNKFFCYDLDKVSEEDWIRATWAQTSSLLLRYAIEHPNGIGKTIVFGHWHTRRLREEFEREIDREKRDSIWKNDRFGVIGLDNCTFYSHKIEMLVVEEA